jgi:hypothetical protein
MSSQAPTKLGHWLGSVLRSSRADGTGLGNELGNSTFDEEGMGNEQPHNTFKGFGWKVACAALSLFRIALGLRAQQTVS